MSTRLETPMQAAARRIAAAFTEWRHRRMAAPDTFLDREDTDALSPEEYGERCAAELIAIIEELFPDDSDIPAANKEVAE